MKNEPRPTRLEAGSFTARVVSRKRQSLTRANPARGAHLQLQENTRLTHGVQKGAARHACQVGCSS